MTDPLFEEDDGANTPLTQEEREQSASTTRREYVSALRAADQHDLRALLRFARS